MGYLINLKFLYWKSNLVKILILAVSLPLLTSLIQNIFLVQFFAVYIHKFAKGDAYTLWGQNADMNVNKAEKNANLE